MQKIVAIVGPTASGKTAFSIELAKRFGGEIISADSMQIYREMAIGTAKPDAQEMDGVAHYLMGHVGVEETYNVAEYVQDAKAVLEQLNDRGVLPIICGGTGLYIQHLLESTDFFDIPISDAVRQSFQKMAKEQGSNALYDLLKEQDPLLAEKLHPNDIKRVIRGLEVFETTGKRLSEFQKESRRESPYEVLYLGLNYRDRSILYERIDRRVDLMMEHGLLAEVEGLLRDFRLSSTAEAAIGYKELIDYFKGNSTLEDAVNLIKQKSRNYAKRQLSWFRREESTHWFYPDEADFDEILEKAYDMVNHFLKGGSL